MKINDPLKQKLRFLYNLVFSLEGSLFRYSLAYSLLLALLPMVIAVVVLFQNSILFDIQIIFNFLYRFIPEELIGSFILYVTDRSYPNIPTLIISLIFTLSLASRSIYSFMLISAKYDEYTLPKFIIRIKAFLLFIVLLATTFFLAIFFALFPFANYIRNLLILFGMFLLFLLFYRVLSFEKKPLSYGVIGAAFTSITLSLTGFLFLFLVRHFTSYASVYGPLAGLVVTLLSLYIIANIIYFGYCLNLVFSPSSPMREYKHHQHYVAILAFLDRLKERGRKQFYKKDPNQD